MIEIVAVVVMGIVVFAFMVAHEKEKQDWKAERGQLLDRIMAKTLPEYVEAETARENTKLKVVRLDELKRELQSEPEQGISV